LQEHFPRGGARNPVAGKTLFDRAIAFLEHRRDRLSPFFLFVQTYSVHDYYNLHPWAVQQLELSEELDRSHVQECAQSLHAGTPEEWELLRDLYRAEVDHVDASLGRLLDAVDRLGLEDSTLILLVSDHGEGFDPERKRIHHGGRPEEDVVRVPFLLSGPGIPPGPVDEPVSLVDVMPTVLDLVGAPIPPDLDGVSLVPVLRGATLPERSLYAMEHHFYWADGERESLSQVDAEPLVLAVMRGPWWFVQHREESASLYEMSSDPQQRSPLPGTHEMRAAIEALADERRMLEGTGEERRVDPEVDAQLRELGYTD
jgi:arylsulfatase A-like enzyme